MERYYRESKLNEIAGGTNQILRTRIVRYLGTDRLGRLRPVAAEELGEQFV